MATSVLVIDDEAPIRLLCRVNLEAEGMEVVEAPDGPSGLELAQEGRPDAILLDVMMPGLDGWAVAEELLGTSAPTRSRSSSSPPAPTCATARGASTSAGSTTSRSRSTRSSSRPLVRGVLEAVESGEREQLRADRIAKIRELYERA